MPCQEISAILIMVIALFTGKSGMFVKMIKEINMTVQQPEIVLLIGLL